MIKRVIPTSHIGQITLEIVSFNEATMYSKYKVNFDGDFSDTTVYLSGDTIESIYREAKMLFNDKLSYTIKQP